jgi:cyclic beta-1,2-glucan synthetase
MILNTELLREKAHEMALSHDPFIIRRYNKRLQEGFYEDIDKLRSFTKSLRLGQFNSAQICSQPAEEWLLDHAEFIEEQVLVIEEQMSKSFIKSLPHFRKTGEPRILLICTDYLEHSEGNLDEDALVAYINYYQEISVLTIAEAWAFPLLLRISLIRRLAAMMSRVREQREECEFVRNLLASIEPSELNQDSLKIALEKTGQERPLSGSLIVHLVKHLREWAEDSAAISRWLICKLENGPESLDRIVSYEYQLQASYQVKTGSLIRSIREISRLDWFDAFERICHVDRILHGESSGDYALLDLSSRDALRKRVEYLAR